MNTLQKLWSDNGYPSTNKLWVLVKQNNLSFKYKDVKDFTTTRTYRKS